MLHKPRYVVGNKYLVGTKLGQGGFGVVHHGLDLETNAHVAIKFEPLNSSHLQREYEVYRLLNGTGTDGIPKIHWFGNHLNHHVLVMDFIPNNLSGMFYKSKRKLPLNKILIWADQMLCCVESMHKHNLIHCDLKPGNFLVDNNQKIYLIDFGLSQQFYDPLKHKHISCVRKGLIGTPRYASINAHLGMQLSRRDDIESLCYIIIKFILGKLPWKKIKNTNRIEEDRKIGLEKQKLKSIYYKLPKEIIEILEYSHSLSFTAKPNYMYIRHLFRTCFYRLGFDENDSQNQYNWNILYPTKRKKSRVISILTRNPENLSISMKYIGLND